MTPQQFRNIALSLSGAVEAEHMGHPDFRVGGKIFASLGAPNENWAMVKFNVEQQARFMAVDDDCFRPCNGAWGQRGYTNVRLVKAKASLVRPAVQLAFDNVSSAAPKPKKRKTK